MNTFTKHAKPKTAKDAIIHTLSTTFPLNAKKLHHTLEREQGMNITYQAVHKSLLELENEHILTKHENAWQLNPAWLDSQENFIRQTRQKYAGNKNKYNIDLNYDGPQVFEFDNFTDFCVETANLIANRKLSPSGKSAYFALQYGWWPFKFKFEQLELLYKLGRNALRSFSVIQKITPFGIWIQKQYDRAGDPYRSLPVGTNVNIQQDIFVQEDWIAQVEISPTGIKHIKHYWNKWKNLEDCYKEFGLKEEPRFLTTVKVTRNPELARYIIQEMEKYMEEAKKHAK